MVLLCERPTSALSSCLSRLAYWQTVDSVNDRTEQGREREKSRERECVCERERERRSLSESERVCSFYACGL